MTHNSLSLSKDRKEYLDIARTIAIICVVLNHAVNRSYSYSYDEFCTIPFASSLFESIIQITSRLGVPLFLMISGALILNKDFSSKEKVLAFYKKNWLPLFITTEIWLFIMFWYGDILYIRDFSVNHILTSCLHCVETMLFINQKTMGSMWYMPMILCLYLILPVLAMVKDRLPSQAIIIPCAIVAISAYCIPEFNDFLKTINVEYKIDFELSASNLFSKFLLLIIAGYYYDKGILANIKTKYIIGAFSLTFVLSVAFQIFVLSSPYYNYAVGSGYSSFLAMLDSMLLFEMIRRVKVNETKIGAFTYLSRISFGIYFVHICIMEGMKAIFANVLLNSIGHTGTLAIYAITSFVGSVLIIYLFSKNKLFKKYFFLIK